MQDYFFSINPKQESLKKHIAYYYFHFSNEKDFKKEFIYYPSFHSTLNVYKNVDIIFNEKGRVYVPKKNDELSVIYTKGDGKSKHIRLSGKFNKIGIVFNSLGFNHFINCPFNSLITDRAVELDYFGSSLISVADKVYKTKDNTKKRDVLDNFFLNHLNVFKEQRLPKIIDIIHDKNGAIQIKELSNTFNIHRKTILRLFKKHLGFSYRDYTNIVKFRNALNLYLTKKDIKLIELAYENDYYDQADFNNQFKALTNLTPKQLFKSLKRMGHNVYWNYLD
ncbi:helix-turn-helix domain-containing protein [Flagellimonas eckloniae]|uniref:HTH araC/xylS-type domain-containing protein n=1 Tax=Flagellimonas eckloniae TaxID=346185 RepID=A0A0N8WFS1_9FLAO|nr:AraC family transcriptional regulator [Allomuricauda eckloniae]KQC29483.1 hypothetical protein AAY42_05925 [Allomuricauda eckloniae]